MHWGVLKDQIVIATRSAVAQLFESHKSEDFYAIALYTDSDAMTVCMAANSEQSLQKDWAAGLELEEEFTDADYAYSKWAIL